MIEVLIILVSDTYDSCQYLDIIIYLVRYNSFMSSKVVLWFVLDLNPLHRFSLLTTWLVLLQVKLCITIMIITKMSYTCTLVYL